MNLPERYDLFDESGHHVGSAERQPTAFESFLGGAIGILLGIGLIYLLLKALFYLLAALFYLIKNYPKTAVAVVLSGITLWMSATVIEKREARRLEDRRYQGLIAAMSPLYAAKQIEIFSAADYQQSVGVDRVTFQHPQGAIVYAHFETENGCEYPGNAGVAARSTANRGQDVPDYFYRDITISGKRVTPDATNHKLCRIEMELAQSSIEVGYDYYFQWSFSSLISSRIPLFSVEDSGSGPLYIGSNGQPYVRIDSRGIPLAGSSQWVGSYECSQGITGLTLDLAVAPDGTATAVFAFYPLAQHPGPLSGSYRLKGEYRLTSLDLSPEEWIDHSQAPRYHMVGLQGIVTLNEQDGSMMLMGRIKECAEFILARVTP